MSYKEFLHKVVDGRMKTVGYTFLRASLVIVTGFCFLLFIAG